jgi:hypothetical protein
MNGRNLLDIQIYFLPLLSHDGGHGKKHPPDGPSLHCAAFQEIGQTDQVNPKGSLVGCRNDMDHCLIGFSIIRSFYYVLAHYRQWGRRSGGSAFHQSSRQFKII